MNGFLKFITKKWYAKHNYVPVALRSGGTIVNEVLPRRGYC